MIEYLIFIILTSIVGVTWVKYLVTPDDVLDFFPELVGKAFSYRRFPKLHKVLYQCEKCASGQIALYAYPIYFFHSYRVDIHLLMIIASIFLSQQIKNLTDQIE